MVADITVEHVYKYPVELVASTHLHKYPNTKDKNVIGIKTLEHKYDVKTGIDYKLRVAECHNVLPSFLRKLSILNEHRILLEEKAWQDHRRRVLRLQSRNLTWAQYANMWEDSTFKPHPDNSNWTLLKQKGVIDICGIGPFGQVIELFAKKFLTHGVKKGINIMEDLLAEKYQAQQFTKKNILKEPSLQVHPISVSS